ncbi:hypothetical protein AVEN_205345-1 [Araneus ventricosus]|uniref:Uncharacterized protein n=1 Tax=Araneus ventricosus TaxID=182803 RepID=A0A4Y2QXY6_ARAVE|nr:hypothetical protein AVEN_205345-1 [Araneus ventricosus]
MELTFRRFSHLKMAGNHKEMHICTKNYCVGSSGILRSIVVGNAVRVKILHDFLAVLNALGDLSGTGSIMTDEYGFNSGTVFFDWLPMTPESHL